MLNYTKFDCVEAACNKTCGYVTIVTKEKGENYMKTKTKKLTITKIACYVVSVLSLLFAFCTTYFFYVCKAGEETASELAWEKYTELQDAKEGLEDAKKNYTLLREDRDEYYRRVDIWEGVVEARKYFFYRQRAACHSAIEESNEFLCMMIIGYSVSVVSFTGALVCKRKVKRIKTDDGEKIDSAVDLDDNRNITKDAE